MLVVNRMINTTNEELLLCGQCQRYRPNFSITLLSVWCKHCIYWNKNPWVTFVNLQLCTWHLSDPWGQNRWPIQYIHTYSNFFDCKFYSSQRNDSVQEITMPKEWRKVIWLQFVWFLLSPCTPHIGPDWLLRLIDFFSCVSCFSLSVGQSLFWLTSRHLFYALERVDPTKQRPQPNPNHQFVFSCVVVLAKHALQFPSSTESHWNSADA